MKTHPLAFLIVLIFTGISFAYPAKVVKVSDGDTITVLTYGKEIRVRLHGIDCPEKNQPYGQMAKEYTTGLVKGRVVDVKPTDTDRYGRIVGWVFRGGNNLNLKLVEQGLAWHYKRYSSDPHLAVAERKSREARNGLWQEANPTPPWEFRRNKKNKSSREPDSDRYAQIIYHGNQKSHIFHRPGCWHYTCKNCTAQFSSREVAIKAGYTPCGRCRP